MNIRTRRILCLDVEKTYGPPTTMWDLEPEVERAWDSEEYDRIGMDRRVYDSLPFSSIKLLACSP